MAMDRLKKRVQALEQTVRRAKGVNVRALFGLGAPMTPDEWSAAAQAQQADLASKVRALSEAWSVNR